MQKILVTRRLAPNILEKLRANFEVDLYNHDQPMPRDELLKRAKGIDGILCLLTDLIDEELIEAAGDNLKVVSTMSVGFDHLDVKALSKKGIKIGYTPDVLTDSVADLTIALMIDASRRVKEAYLAAEKGEWDYWRPYYMTGYDLSNSTVGIVGLGRIGLAVAKRLKGFGVEIIYYDKIRKEDIEKEHGIKYVSRSKLYETSDFITVHTAYMPDNHQMFNKTAFEKMKDNAVFVNTSRGALVDHDDLYQALKTNNIFAAALDTTLPEPLPTNHKLFSLKNCLILPHIGSASVATRDQMGLIAVENIICALTGKEMPKEVKL